MDQKRHVGQQRDEKNDHVKKHACAVMILVCVRRQQAIGSLCWNVRVWECVCVCKKQRLDRCVCVCAQNSDWISVCVHTDDSVSYICIVAPSSAFCVGCSLQ